MTVNMGLSLCCVNQSSFLIHTINLLYEINSLYILYTVNLWHKVIKPSILSLCTATLYTVACKTTVCGTVVHDVFSYCRPFIYLFYLFDNGKCCE